ncbi:hypothetical protein COOONC_22620 [Cooperia oncophora]
MLHKAPAAFGLVSFLLMEGIDVRSARKHLLVFSFAAPFAAVVTFAVIESLGRDSLWSSESSTGVLMLFSAGTFLFVATVHVLPELANRAKSVKDYMLVVDAQSPATAGHSHSGWFWVQKRIQMFSDKNACMHIGSNGFHDNL